MRINIERLMESIERMGRVGATESGGVTRLALSDTDKQARDMFVHWCENVGMVVRIDDFGNVIARRRGTTDQPPLVMGSHLDSVPEGGHYDGVLGVLGALEVVRTLNDHHVTTERPIEVVNWMGEEGSRFHPGMLGSWGAFGVLSPQEALSVVDADGVSAGDELRRIRYDGAPSNRPTDIGAYLELHIEQGPVLEASDHAVGLVQGIIGQSWQTLTVAGRAGHAGANPMHLRADALVAAAELTVELRQLALKGKDYSVATVGIMRVIPGSSNVIPSRVEFTVDIRCATAEDLAMIEEGLVAACRSVEAREGVSVTTRGYGSTASQAFDEDVMAAIRSAIHAEGLPLHELWSGAGHDAHTVARHHPAGMIFVRSRDGLSHHPAEYSSSGDIEAGVNVLLQAALTLAGVA